MFPHLTAEHCYTKSIFNLKLKAFSIKKNIQNVINIGNNCILLWKKNYIYTVFRQAFLLIQYSFICKQYFFCSDREYQYFFDRW